MTPTLEKLRTPGITIEVAAAPPGAPANRPWIAGRLVVSNTDADADNGGPESWVRALFVTAITHRSVGYIANIHGARLLLADDIKKLEGPADKPAIAFDFHFDLFDKLQAPGFGSHYFVHVAARHHRSNVLTLVIPPK